VYYADRKETQILLDIFWFYNVFVYSVLVGSNTLRIIMPM